MVVGCLLLTLTVFESASLKDKRSVVRRVSERLRNKFQLAVAEVDTLDDRSVATIAAVCVSNDARHAHAMLMKALDFVETLHLDAEITEVQTEIVHAL